MINRIVALVLAGVASTSVPAAVLYDAGAPDFTQTQLRVSEGTLRVADDFTLTSPGTIRSVQFWGTHFSSGVVPAVEDFVVNVYGARSEISLLFPLRLDTASILGTTSATLVERLDTGVDFPGPTASLRPDMLSYTVNLVTPITLGAGTYWFSVHLGTDAPATQFAWARTANLSGSVETSNDAGQTFGPIAQGNVAFVLSDASATPSSVPEPGSLALLGLGVAGLAFVRRGVAQRSER